MIFTHLSLFSGIGGLDLAAEWAGFTTIGQCEWADYPTKVLEKHWPDVPRWRDIRTLTRESFCARTGLRTVDVVSGGFPCQPFSVAGKQKGKRDDRYLWPEMYRVIRELTPRWIVGENVPGILRIAATDVVQNLEHEGYRVAIFDFEAAAVGAPHRRERVFFVANAESVGLQRHGANGEQECRTRLETQESCGNGSVCTESTDFLRHTNGICAGTQREIPREQKDPDPCGSGTSLSHNVNGSGVVRGDWELPAVESISRSREDYGRRTAANEPGQRWTTEPRLVRMVDGVPHWLDEPDIPRTVAGIPHRADRIKCLGNAVVPQQAYPIFAAIAEEIRRHE